MLLLFSKINKSRSSHPSISLVAKNKLKEYNFSVVLSKKLVEKNTYLTVLSDFGDKALINGVQV